MFQFGRYLLISSSRPGTQPANLQGIWNKDMNPMWDSKYTTNINTEMNYWPAEVANLAECAEPLFRMIRELTDQGADVAREHYGARGWVLPPEHRPLARGRADGRPELGRRSRPAARGCATHLWEHYLFTGDTAFLREYYPVMKGAAEFFLDFLVPHPTRGWLVTNPSTSPENFPLAPGNDRFFDEVTGSMSPGTTLVAGSTIDMQILGDLFGYVAEAAAVLGTDPDFRRAVLAARAKLAPDAGRAGTATCRSGSTTGGSARRATGTSRTCTACIPGNQVSPRRTPALADAAPRRARAARPPRQRLGVGVEGGRVGPARRTAPKALENVTYAADELHDDEPVLDLLEARCRWTARSG